MIIKEDKLGLNNPLPYIFAAFILSSFFYKFYSSDKLMAIVIVISFFVLLIFYKGIIVSIILSLFFFAALYNNILFYNYMPNDIEEIRIEKIKSYYTIGKISGRFVYLDLDKEDLKEGDKITAKGSFKANKDIDKGIIGEYKVKNYTVNKADLISKLYDRREMLYESIKAKLGQRKAGLITSVAFGYSDALDNEDKEDMKVFGISHAVSVSGLHMAIVYGVLKMILGTKISLLIAFIYVLFTGAASSTVRSFVMIFIMSFAVVVKRNYNPLASISLAGIMLLLINPYDLFSLGFQLSFLATLGIILFNKNLNKKLYKIPEYIRKSICVSLSAQVLTLPILIYSFNEFSLNFILGNLLILPFINILVGLGNLLLLVYKFKIIFNYLLFLCYCIIKFLDNIVDLLWIYKADILYLNYTAAYFYSILLIAFYFYKKNYKEFIMLPVISLIYIGIITYNPVPNIKYYREGAILISFRGDKVLIQTKAVIDKVKLKKITMTDKIYKDFYKIKVGNEMIIRKDDKNYVIDTGEKEYMLLVNKEKINNEYDIIDFSTGKLQEVIIFDDKVISR